MLGHPQPMVLMAPECRINNRPMEHPRRGHRRPRAACWPTPSKRRKHLRQADPKWPLIRRERYVCSYASVLRHSGPFSIPDLRCFTQKPVHLNPVLSVFSTEITSSHRGGIQQSQSRCLRRASVPASMQLPRGLRPQRVRGPSKSVRAFEMKLQQPGAPWNGR